MPKDLLSRYVWLLDTIRRHGSISRRLLNEKWMLTPYSGGQPLARRTFYNYRAAIEELFQVTISCDHRTNEYYLEDGDPAGDRITDWLLNSAAMSEVLGGSRDISDRIFLEEVPSARRYLHVVIDAMRSGHQLRFSYHPYTRSNPTRDNVIEPYFLKIFRQRWYVTGMNTAQRKLKTYALDRMGEVAIGSETFVMPADFDPRGYQADSFGIIFDEGVTHDVALRVTPRKAKYLRALPLHPSQRESIHDTYSLFTYRIKLTPDFLQELLSHGPDIVVERPAELRAMVTASLRATLAGYSGDTSR